ncbi:MAG: hypothetical protein R2854_17725 [Caldilineaceae bacterium]
MQRPGDAAPVAMDAPALAGARVRPDMWVDHIIGPNPDGWGYFLEGKVNDAGLHVHLHAGHGQGVRDR